MSDLNRAELRKLAEAAYIVPAPTVLAFLDALDAAERDRDRYKPTTIALYKQRAADVAAIVKRIDAEGDRHNANADRHRASDASARANREQAIASAMYSLRDAIERGDWHPEQLPPDPREEEIQRLRSLLASVVTEVERRATAIEAGARQETPYTAYREASRLIRAALGGSDV